MLPFLILSRNAVKARNNVLTRWRNQFRVEITRYPFQYRNNRSFIVPLSFLSFLFEKIVDTIFSRDSQRRVRERESTIRCSLPGGGGGREEKKRPQEMDAAARERQPRRGNRRTIPAYIEMTLERDLQLDNMCWTDHLSRKQVPVEWPGEQRHIPPSSSFLFARHANLSIRDEAENRIPLRANCTYE